MTAEHLDSEAEQIKEVYAYFGLAMYRAQCLERQLAIVLATRYGPGPTKITNVEYDGLLESLFSKTMGRLVRDIGEVAKLSEREEEQLREALNKRNWLAHRYFWERARVFLSASGRVAMIQELQETVDILTLWTKSLPHKQWSGQNPGGLRSR